MSWFSEVLGADAGRVNELEQLDFLMAVSRIGRLCARALDEVDFEMKSAARQMVATYGIHGPFAIADLISKAAAMAINASTVIDIERLGMGRDMTRGNPHPKIIALDPWTKVVSTVAIAALHRLSEILERGSYRLTMVQARAGRVRMLDEPPSIGVRGVAIVTLAVRSFGPSLEWKIDQSTGPVMFSPSMDAARQRWLGVGLGMERPKSSIDEGETGAWIMGGCKACGHYLSTHGGNGDGACRFVSMDGACTCERWVRPDTPAKAARPPTGAGDAT